MVMKNKKGLSDVIATVLIILLALAAIVIIWTFVRSGIIDPASRTAGAQGICFETELSVVSCVEDAGAVNGTINIYFIGFIILLRYWNL